MSALLSSALRLRNLPDFHVQRKAKTLLYYVFIVVLSLCFYSVFVINYCFVFDVQRYDFFGDKSQIGNKNVLYFGQNNVEQSWKMYMGMAVIQYFYGL